MSYHLTSFAYNDLKEIAVYTKEQFGINQMEIYIKQFDNSFSILDKFHFLGQSANEIRSGYFKYIVGKHLIFYREINKNEIQIVRILHQQMDIENYL